MKNDKNLKLVTAEMPNKLELALENAENQQEEFDIVFKTRMFYQKHLMDIIELNDKHDFLSDLESICLKNIATLLEDNIIEQISEFQNGMYSPSPMTWGD